jgi:hypothetical protein
MPTEGDDRLPFTCLVPDGPGVIDIFDQTAALRIAVVEREGVGWLSQEWDTPGAYVLLDRPHADGTWSAYVGKAPAGLKSRVASHVKTRCASVIGVVLRSLSLDDDAHLPTPGQRPSTPLCWPE